jgi:PAS domain S-box-containing protein
VIVITDVEGTIEYVNPAFTKVTGYEHEEAIGRNPSILKSGEQDVSFYRDMWEQLNSGHVWRGRFVNRRKDGELYTEEATITPVRDADGNVVNFVAVKRDITDELKRERQFQQVERIEAVGQLAGGVAHDFNNLLTGIMNYVDLCLDRVSGDATLSGYLAQLKVDAERSANLTKQLLAFARRQEISPEVLDLNEVVSGTLDLLRRLIGEDIRLRWLPNPEPVPVRVDPSQLDQVLVNLIINARDAIGGVGTIVVSTKCRTIADTDRPFSPDARPGEWVVLAVADDGEGMSPDTMANIFEPFFTTKAASEGTGLGLSTVYGIVKQNLGFIDVSSELGEGTVFSIHLPRVSGAAAELQHPRETAERSDRVVQGGGETILVVEDERSIRTTCRAFLEKLGYKVLVASDPTEALRLVGGYEDVLHLVITDVVMPGMNGAQLAGKLREQRPGLACIFMSGYTDDIIANRGVLEHDTEFLGKPFTREDLEATVRRVLDAS